MGGAHRFDDPFLAPAPILPGFAKQLDVLGEHKGAWEKAELPLAEACLHLGQVPPQPILPSNLKGAWEVVQLKEKEKECVCVRVRR